MKRLLTLVIALCSIASANASGHILFNPPVEYSDQNVEFKEIKGISFYAQSVKWGKTVVGRQLHMMNTTSNPICVMVNYPKSKNVLSQLFDIQGPFIIDAGEDRFLGTYWAKEITQKAHQRISVRTFDKTKCL
ncbi:hypothetical protein HBN50_10575 [Halobacteriovorax sp. GB3]|uniref:hypothetical protein n=1 Tax=Halobacteriovorax sp. GB3 TaxID=2719615 RepID=UPI00236170C8|nr:hypothetical protein [Halobacteriovorax sp. GB3]MDD0853546.1 hypothetical protein [Halobacteriovorax sp. GB3]